MQGSDSVRLITWPSAEPVVLTVFTGGAVLTLPVRPPRFGDAQLAPFPPPEVGPAMERTVLRASTGARSISRDIMTGEFVSIVDDDYGRTRIEATGIEQENTRYAEYHITEGDPRSATMETRWMIGIGGGDWQTRTVTRVVMTSTRDSFRIRAELDAYEGEERIMSRNWRNAMYIHMQDLMEDSGSYLFLTHGVNASLARDTIQPGLSPDGLRQNFRDFAAV